MHTPVIRLTPDELLTDLLNSIYFFHIIPDISNDLCDGVILAALLEVLSEEPVKV